MKNISLIICITGQDDSYFAGPINKVIKKNYEVHVIIRIPSSFNKQKINHLYNNRDILNQKLFFHYGDLTNSSILNRLIQKTIPAEIYNLGAQSHIKISFDFLE